MSTFPLLQYTDEDRREILKQYGRTPENIHEDVDKIKEWLAKQPHLPEIPSDKMIENYLLLSKFGMEIAKKKIDMYYSIRSLIPEYFDKHPNGLELQKAMSVNYVMLLPKLTKDKHRVGIITKLKDENPDNFCSIANSALSYSYIEMRLRYDCVTTLICVYDLANIQPGHLTKYTPAVIKKHNFISENAFTNRIHGIHLINAPAFANAFLTVVKSYLKPKVANRIYIHATMDTFYEMVPKDILPKDFGGKERSLDELTDEWKKAFLKNDSLFTHLLSLKTNEALRPGKPLNTDVLGIEGNFRKLDVD